MHRLTYGPSPFVAEDATVCSRGCSRMTRPTLLQVSAAANMHHLVRVFPDGMYTAYAPPVVSRLEPPGEPA